MDTGVTLTITEGAKVQFGVPNRQLLIYLIPRATVKGTWRSPELRLNRLNYFPMMLIPNFANTYKFWRDY